jgi:hypothetical protein
MAQYSLNKVCTRVNAVISSIRMPACEQCMPECKYSHPAKEANDFRKLYGSKK